MALTRGFKRLSTVVVIAGVVGLGYYVVQNYAPQGSRGTTVKSSASAAVRTKASVPKVKNSVTVDNPISVCVVTWPGYAGGQYFNGGFAASKDSRYYKDYGILVEFKLIDDFLASREAWKNDQCEVLWQTVDAYGTEVEGLTVFGPRGFFQSDWSYGGDVAVATRDITSVNDLRGKAVAAALGTPSQTFLLRMLQAAGMKQSDVKFVSTNSAPEANALFKARQVPAAIVWSPDDVDALANVPGSHRLASTREASQIIADFFFAKAVYIDSHLPELAAMVDGWLRGAAEINADPQAKEQAVQILAAGLNQPESFIREVIDNARLTTYQDNVNFFNLEGTYAGVTGQELYETTGRLFAEVDLAPRVLPSWRSVTDLRVLRMLKLSGPEHAAWDVPRFSRPSEEVVKAGALTTKPVTITFPTGSATLDDNMRYIIDEEFAETARTMLNLRIRIEGNTDNIGSAATNEVLSLRRAQAVADYLVNKYRFDPNRFVVTGNGPRKPAASNDTEAGRQKNRRTDFELLRQ
ncbi:MAG: hypothetical protein A2939_04205 [Parcubacteria group bacterium RIFCSPLOWO2_01_FULL_48_18]|nr:MAG: hypothetical protein A2939_04205 [Parcubacteria group bacterium RIFCSPLOWO2_01_FULL_48_18]